MKLPQNTRTHTHKTWTLQAEPFLYRREALLDSALRAALILVLCVGAAVAGGFLNSTTGDTLLLGIGVAGVAAALVWGDAIGAVATLAGQALFVADDRVNGVLFRQVQ